MINKCKVIVELNDTVTLLRAILHRSLTTLVRDRVAEAVSQLDKAIELMVEDIEGSK